MSLGIAIETAAVASRVQSSSVGNHNTAAADSLAQVLPLVPLLAPYHHCRQLGLQ